MALQRLLIAALLIAGCGGSDDAARPDGGGPACSAGATECRADGLYTCDASGQFQRTESCTRCEPAPTPPPDPTPCDPTLQECPSPTPLPEGVEVSSFRCLSVDLVGDALTANSLAVGAMTPPGLQGDWVVEAQSPEAGMLAGSIAAFTTHGDIAPIGPLYTSAERSSWMSYAGYWATTFFSAHWRATYLISPTILPPRMTFLLTCLWKNKPILPPCWKNTLLIPDSDILLSIK